MRLVVLQKIPEDAELRQHWNALVERSDRPQVFYTYEWALAVQRAYHATLSPLVMLAYDEENTLCGLVALATGADRRQASFLCATTGDYCDFLSAPQRRSEFVGLVLGELNRQKIWGMALANLPADSPTLEALRGAAAQHGSHRFARSAYVCAQIVFERLERTKDGKPYAPGLKRLKRFTKAMAPAEPVRTEHLRSWEAVGPALPEFEKAHVARFLEIGRISNIADRTRRVFLEELVRLLPEQWLVLSRMWAGNRVVAWHYGFQFHGSWFWYQPTFDSSVEKHWPGFCLLSQVIEDAIDMPAMTMLDLGLGSEAYKAKFANESRETLYVTLHRSIVAHWGTMIRYRIAEAVKASPKLEKIAESVRKKMRGLRARARENGAAGRLARRAVHVLWKRDEVVFFEKEGSGASLPGSRGLQLQRLELRHLAAAVMEYRDDEETCVYLIRAAHRLRTPAEGYVLLDAGCRPMHFAWTNPMDGFFCAELRQALTASSDAVLVFDCWTPTALRGQKYYSRAIELIGGRIQASGKQPWIFGASSNIASVRGIERAGFRRRYSLISHRLLTWHKIKRVDSALSHEAAAEVSAQV